MIATGASPLSHRSTNLSGLKSPADDAFRAKSGELKLHGNQNGSFAPDASLHPIETGELVLRASLQTLFEVNTAGAFIWCCLDDGLTLDETGREVADHTRHFRRCPQVRQTSVGNWWDLELVDGSPSPSVPNLESGPAG